MPVSAKQVVKAVMPPIILTAASTLLRGRAAGTAGELFDGRDDLFIEALAEATVYGEYGPGASTRYVARETTLPIVSIDTSASWVNSVRQSLHRQENVDIWAVDVGPITEFGRPTSYAARERFADYIFGLWTGRRLLPDLVLIDGRFRVACFLASLLSARPGAAIIFDDYARDYYHVVEEVVAPTVVSERQALFHVPPSFDDGRARSLLTRFECVFD